MKQMTLLTMIGAILLCPLPARPQDIPELDGAPPPLRIPKAAPVKPRAAQPAPSIRTRTSSSGLAKTAPAGPKAQTPARSQPRSQPRSKPRPEAASKAASDAPAPAGEAEIRAARDRLASDAAAQSARAARLDEQAAELSARGKALEARAAALAAAEQKFAEKQMTEEAALSAREADLARRLAAAGPARDAQGADRRQPAVLPGSDAGAPAVNPPDPPDIAAAAYACLREAEALAGPGDYVRASYASEPRLNPGTMQLRGRMRLSDPGGYSLVDSFCQLSREGEALSVDFFR